VVSIGIIFWFSGNLFKHLAKSVATQAASVSLSILTDPDPWGKMNYCTIILSSLAETLQMSDEQNEILHNNESYRGKHEY
jgi:hypothetical protein